MFTHLHICTYSQVDKRNHAQTTSLPDKAYLLIHDGHFLKCYLFNGEVIFLAKCESSCEYCKTFWESALNSVKQSIVNPGSLPDPIEMASPNPVVEPPDLKHCDFCGGLGITSLKNDLNGVNWPTLTRKQKNKKLKNLSKIKQVIYLYFYETKYQI